FVVAPSCAVTIAVTVLLPTTNGIAALDVPLVVGDPLTTTVALTSASDGMNEMFSTSFATFTVYELVFGAKTGAKAPALGMRFCKSAFGVGLSVRFSALELRFPFPARLVADPARIRTTDTPNPD